MVGSLTLPCAKPCSSMADWWLPGSMDGHFHLLCLGPKFCQAPGLLSPGLISCGDQLSIRGPKVQAHPSFFILLLESRFERGSVTPRFVLKIKEEAVPHRQSKLQRWVLVTPDNVSEVVKGMSCLSFANSIILPGPCKMLERSMK